MTNHPFRCHGRTVFNSATEGSLVTGLRNSMISLLALAALVVGAGLWLTDTSPYGSPEARPVRKGPQPAPTTSDGRYVHLTGSWDTGRTAAMSYTAASAPSVPACGDIVCNVSPTKITIQVRKGDLIVLVVTATAHRGGAFCSIRLSGESDAQLVKPHKNNVLDVGTVECRRRIP